MASLFIMMNENEIDMIGIRKPRKRLKGEGKTLVARVLVLFVFLLCGTEAFSAKGSSGGVGDVEKYYKGLQESKKLPLQVFLEVNIFEVILRNEDDIGFIYDILGEVGEFRGTTLAGDPIIESNLGVLGRSARDSLMPAGANIAAAVFEGDSGEIQTVFQALTEDQIVQIHANPIILTVEGYPAQLKSGDEVPFLSRAVLGNTETFVSESAQTGVDLVIKPDISYMDMDVDKENPYITIEINAHLSSVTRFREEEGFTQPIIDDRQYTTIVCLKEGERILIGGLFRDSAVKDSRGVPILKDIPILGRLFRSTSNKRTVSQLFVMVRPLILDIWSEEGQERKFLDDKAFKRTRKFLDKETENMGTKANPFEEFRELFIEHGTPD